MEIGSARYEFALRSLTRLLQVQRTKVTLPRLGGREKTMNSALTEEG